MEQTQSRARQKAGLLVRTYAKDPTGIKERVTWTEELVLKAMDLKFGERPVLTRVDILVFANPSYQARDCGLLAPALSSKLSGIKQVHIHLLDSKEIGDNFCGTLNHGLRLHRDEGISQSFIWSPETNKQFSAGNVCRMLDCVERGCLAAGLALPELGPAALEGRIANTAILWSTDTLLLVGGFDKHSALSADPAKQVYITTKSGERHPLAGVEEMIPLARAYRLWNRRIGVVVPEDPKLRYAESENPERRKENALKFELKRERQDEMLARAGFSAKALDGIVSCVV